MPCIINAANEIAVESFLNHEILYTQIVQTIDNVLNEISSEPASSLELVLEIDHLAREKAKEFIKRISN